MFTCYVCQQNFNEFKIIAKHLRNDHLLGPSSVHQCCILNCDQTFPSFRSFSKHSRLCHNNKLDNSQASQKIVPISKKNIKLNCSHLVPLSPPKTSDNTDEAQSTPDLTKSVLMFTSKLHNKNTFSRKDVVDLQNDITNLVISPIGHFIEKLYFSKELEPQLKDIISFCKNPSVIKMSGPLKYLWSFRFESKHRELKTYARSISSRKNISLTLAIKSQLKFADRIMLNKFNEKVYIEDRHQLNIAHSEKFKSVSNIFIKFKKTHFKNYSSILFKGTKYKLGYYLVKHLNNFDVQIFKIEDILVYKNNTIFLVCTSEDIIKYHPHYMSYEVNTIIKDFDKDFIFDIEYFDGPPIHIYKIPNGKNMFRIKSF